MIRRSALMLALIYIVSPSLWWDKGMIFPLEKQRLAKQKDLKAKAYIAVGGLETAAHGTEEMVGDARQFVNRLNAHKFAHFRSRFWIAPDESHHSVIPAALMRGITWVFSP